MKAETITRIKLTAEDGMILTNGEIYGKEIFLAEGISSRNFYEIAETEYEKMIEKQEENLAMEVQRNG